MNVSGIQLSSFNRQIVTMLVSTAMGCGSSWPQFREANFPANACISAVPLLCSLIERSSTRFVWIFPPSLWARILIASLSLLSALLDARWCVARRIGRGQCIGRGRCIFISPSKETLSSIVMASSCACIGRGRYIARGRCILIAASQGNLSSIFNGFFLRIFFKPVLDGLIA